MHILKEGLWLWKGQMLKFFVLFFVFNTRYECDCTVNCNLGEGEEGKRKKREQILDNYGKWFSYQLKKGWIFQCWYGRQCLLVGRRGKRRVVFFSVPQPRTHSLLAFHRHSITRSLRVIIGSWRLTVWCIPELHLSSSFLLHRLVSTHIRRSNILCVIVFWYAFLKVLFWTIALSH